jgi:hypothetical protein
MKSLIITDNQNFHDVSPGLHFLSCRRSTGPNSSQNKNRMSCSPTMHHMSSSVLDEYRGFPPGHPQMDRILSEAQSLQITRFGRPQGDTAKESRGGLCKDRLSQIWVDSRNKTTLSEATRRTGPYTNGLKHPSPQLRSGCKSTRPQCGPTDQHSSKLEGRRQGRLRHSAHWK